MPYIYLSTMAAGNMPILNFARLAREFGMAGIELSSSLPLSAGDFFKVREQMPSGIRFLVHNYFPSPSEDFVLNLASPDQEILRKSRDHCANAVTFCSEVASPFYSVHAGFALNAAPSDLGKELAHLERCSLADAKKVFINSLNILCRQAQSKGMRILVENNVLAPFNLVRGRNEFLLGVTAEDLLELLANVNMPNLGLLIDMGHLKVSARSLGFSDALFLKTLMPYIEAFHLSDNDGNKDDNYAFNETAWFFKHLRDLKTEHFIIEVHDGAIPSIPQMITGLRNLIIEKGQA